jgi:hypothetical protein
MDGKIMKAIFIVFHFWLLLSGNTVGIGCSHSFLGAMNHEIQWNKNAHNSF